MQRCMGCMREFSDELNVCPHCGYVVGTPAESKTHLEPGTVLHGHFTLGKVLGQGGFGITYIAWDSNVGRAVAIKEYLPNAFASRLTGEKDVSCYSAEAQQQFTLGLEKTRREAHALSAFGTLESVVKVYDCIEENKTAYIVMELLRGSTVKEILAQRGKLTYAETMRIMTPVLQTLDAMYQVGMIHRDVSPDNIFVCDNGKIKLLDFGAARVVSGVDNKSLSVMLKHGFAPIEQYSSRGKQGAYTDVYAAGATIYKMLTGETPPDSVSRDRHGHDLHALSRTETPPEAQKTILNAMELNAEERIPSAAALLELLQKDLSDRIDGIDPREFLLEQKKRKAKKRLPVIAAAVLCAAVVILGVFAFKSKLFKTEPAAGTTAAPSSTTDAETAAQPASTDAAEAQTTHSAFTAADLRAVLENETDAEIIEFSCFDYNNDGAVEAFALVGNKAPDENDIEDYTITEGKIVYIRDQSVQPVLDIAYPYVNSRLFPLDQSRNLFGYGVNQSGGGSGSVTALYTVDARGAYTAIMGGSLLAGIPTGSENGWMEGLFSAFDMFSDGTGHTWKPYFFYYDSATNSIVEYGGAEITEEELYALSPDVRDCINRAKQSGAIDASDVIDSVYYRKNGIVNINFTGQPSDGISAHHYINLLIRNGKAALYKPADPDAPDATGVGDGHYKKYITQLKVDFPDETPDA